MFGSRHTRNYGRALCIAVVLAACLTFAPLAHADTSSSLIITPSKIELQLEPGDVATFTVDVSNTSTSTMALEMAAWDFARDENGTVRKVAAADADTFHGCSQWVQLPFSKMRFLEPGSKNSFEFEVRVPKDAPDDESRFCYLQFKGSVLATSGQTPTADESVVVPTVSYSMNGLLLVQVGDPAALTEAVLREGVSVRSLNVKPFNFNPEVALRTAIYNKGNIHASLAQGSGIQIWQGDTLKASIPFKEFTLLPESTIAVSTVWRPDVVFGRFTARFVGDIGLTDPITAQKTFWVIKPWFFAVVIASAILLIVLMVLFFKRFRIQLRPRTEESGG